MLLKFIYRWVDYPVASYFKLHLFQLLTFTSLTLSRINLLLGLVFYLYDVIIKKFEKKLEKSYSTKYLLALLDLLIRPPVDPARHLPSVLSILQYLAQNPHLVKNNQVNFRF